MRKYLVLALVLVLTLLVLTPLVSSSNQFNFPTDYVSWWRFENNGNDESGLNDGSVVGATYTPSGKFGGAYDFDGVNDYVSVDSKASLNLGTESTWSWWMKSGSSQISGLNGIITRGTSTNTYSVRLGSTNVLEFRFYGSETISSGVNPSTNWEHWVIAKNNRNFKFYKNGQFVVERNANYDLVNQGTFYLAYYENYQYFNGTIDEVMIFNRTLSSTEVEQLYLMQVTEILSCSIIPTASCTGENELIAYLKNDTAGYNNAHMALANYSSDYPYVVCCNASDVNQSVKNSCDDEETTTFLKSFSQTNTHVQNPSVNTYTYDSCLGITKYSSNFNYKDYHCALDETCLLSISNSTNAHVGNCSHYTTQVCANLTFTNNLPEVTQITLAPEGANTTTNLECTFVVEDQDAEDTLSANYAWYRNNELQSGLSGTLSPVINGTQNTVYLLSENTAHFQNWSCAVTPYDSYQYGETNFSNNITIVNSAPSIPTQLTPQNGKEDLTNRNVNFSWSPSTDPDGDEITYVINLTNAHVGGFYENTTNQSYIHSSELSTNDETQGELYYWQIKACDPYGACSEWSPLWNFSIMAVLWIETINGEIDFGQVQIDQTYDTLDPAYDPFLFENYGNVEADLINITGDDLWATQPLDGTEYVQMKANYSSAQSPYNEAGTKEDWFNVSNGDYSESLISQFDYHTNTKEVLMDLRIKVPTVEDPGSKTTTLTFYWMKS